MQVIDLVEFFTAAILIKVLQVSIGAVFTRVSAGLPTKLSTVSVGDIGCLEQAYVPRERQISWAIISPAPNRAEKHLLTIIQAAGWPIWPLIACSVLAVALIIERFIALKSARVAPPNLLEEAVSVSSVSLPGPETVAQLASNSQQGEVLAAGLRMLHHTPRCSESDLRSAMEGAGRAVAHRLEKSLMALATIASAAPLLGLLGTVIGMIEIFGAQTSGATGMGNPAQLAHGISVALYNTAFGLIVAIPALIFWRYFRSRVDAYLLTLELSSEQFLRHLLRMQKK